MSSQSEPLKATVSSHLEKPQEAASSHFEPWKSHVRFVNSKFAGDRGAAVPCSRLLLAHRSWSRGCIGQLFHLSARPPHLNQQLAAQPTVLLILLAHVVQSGWWCYCVFTGTFINRSSYNRCERRNRALLLRSSSRLQLRQSRQPCVAAVTVLGAGQAVVSRGRGREWFCKSRIPEAAKSAV